MKYREHWPELVEMLARKWGKPAAYSRAVALATNCRHGDDFLSYFIARYKCL